MESTTNQSSKAFFRNSHMQKARELKNSIRMDKRYYAHCKAEETEEASSRNDQHKLFRITKQLFGNRSRAYNGVIEDANGKKLTKDEDKKTRWPEHFKDVPNSDDPLITEDIQDNPLHQLEIDGGPVTIEELNSVILKLKNNKRPGDDCISG